MVDTIKFSEMTDGGDLANGEKTPGLLGGANVLFNNPWTFLPSGTTADRPSPSSLINYRLRFNTTDQLYEYYDAVLGAWTQLQESAFTQGPFVIYTADPSIPDGQNLGALADGILKQTITLGVATVDIAVNGVDYWAPGDALTRTQVPTIGDDVTNKTYVDGLDAGNVKSVSGTTNRVTSTGGANPIIDISAAYVGQASITTLGTVTTGVWNGTLISPIFGGTGVNNGTNTLTLAGNLSTSGAFSSSFAMTGATNVTFPTTGTLATTSQLPTPAALTASNDTNVTLTLGGTPSTSLLQATSLTLGWTGILAIGRGGTGVSSVTSSPTASAWAGWDTNKNMSANNFLGATTVYATGTTLTLTVSSSGTYIFTGSSGQNVILPVVTTLAVGQTYKFISNSLDAVSIISSGGTIIYSMPPLSTVTMVYNGTVATDPTSWNYCVGIASIPINVSMGGTGLTALGSGVQSALGLPVNGSGSMALTSSPSFTTPNIGVSTATSINFGGSTLSNYSQFQTFTPVVTFATPGNLSVAYGTQVGLYSRIGNIVKLIISLSFTPTFTTASGNFNITGLPFSSNATSGNVAIGNCFLQTSLFPTGTTSLACELMAGSNILLAISSGSGVNAASFTTTQLVSGYSVSMSLSITYLV